MLMKISGRIKVLSKRAFAERKRKILAEREDKQVPSGASCHDTIFDGPRRCASIRRCARGVTA